MSDYSVVVAGSIPHGELDELFHVPTSVSYLVLQKGVVCAVLSVGWCIYTFLFMVIWHWTYCKGPFR